VTRRGRLRLAVLDLLDEPWITVVLGASIVLHGGRWVASALSTGAGSRGARDFVVWWTWVFLGALASWIGSRSLAGPLSTGSAQWILAGPVRPTTWAAERVAVTILGGLLACLVVGGQAVAYGASPWWLWSLALENVLIVALGALYGLGFRPLLAVFLTAATWWITHLIGPWTLMLRRTGHDQLALLVAWMPDADVYTVPAVGASLARVGTATMGAGAWLLVLAGVLVVSMSRRSDY
jgi:hypothetical protein